MIRRCSSGFVFHDKRRRRVVNQFGSNQLDSARVGIQGQELHTVSQTGFTAKLATVPHTFVVKLKYLLRSLKPYHLL